MISIDLLVGEISGLSRPDLDRWIANDWIRPDRDMGIYIFQDIDVARVRLIRDLRDDLGVNEDALPIVLLLLDQLYDLRRHMLGFVRQPGGNPPLPTLGQLICAMKP
jgi:chaperone modulatory protein CbpM